MGCSANQDWLTNYEIITIKEPEYRKKEPSCDDEQMMRDLAKKCDRISDRVGGLETPGEYELIKRADD